MVREARQLDADQKSGTREDVERLAEDRDRRKRLVEEVEPEIAAKFETGAAASDGAMRFTPPAAPTTGVTQYRLDWLAPGPARGLSIIVGHARGEIEWGWQTRSGYRRIDAIEPWKLRDDLLDQLIRGLCDQATWSKGEIPLISPP